MLSPLEEHLAANPSEASLTITQDVTNSGRVLFTLDLAADKLDPDESAQFATCDLVALTLFNLARTQAAAFNDTYLKVLACITDIGIAQMNGATPEDIAALRLKHGIEFVAD